MRTTACIVVLLLIFGMCNATSLEKGHWSFQIVERLIGKGFIRTGYKLTEVSQREDMARIISKLFENISDDEILKDISLEDIEDIRLILDEFVAEMGSAYSDKWLFIRTKISEYEYKLKNKSKLFNKKKKITKKIISSKISPIKTNKNNIQSSKLIVKNYNKDDIKTIKDYSRSQIKKADLIVKKNKIKTVAKKINKVKKDQTLTNDEEERKTELEFSGNYETEYENFSATHKAAFENTSEYDDGDEASIKMNFKLEETTPDLDITTTKLSVYKHKDALEKAAITVNFDGKKILSAGENLSVPSKNFGKYSGISKTRGVKVVNKLKDGNLTFIGGKYIQSQLADVSVAGVAYNKTIDKRFSYKLSGLSTGEENTVTDSGVSVLSGEFQYKRNRKTKTIFTVAKSRSGKGDTDVNNYNQDGGAFDMKSYYAKGKASWDYEYEHISDKFEALTSATKTAEKNAIGLTYKFSPFIMKKFNYEVQTDKTERTRKLLSFLTINKKNLPSIVAMYVDQKKVTKGTDQDTKIRLSKIGVSKALRTFTPMMDFKRLNVTIDSANYDKQTNTYTLGAKKSFGNKLTTNYSYIITNETGTNAYRKRKNQVSLTNHYNKRIDITGKYYHEKTYRYENIEEDFAEMTMKYAMEDDIDIYFSFIQNNYNHLDDDTKDFSADGIKIKYKQKF